MRADEAFKFARKNDKQTVNSRTLSCPFRIAFVSQLIQLNWQKLEQNLWANGGGTCKNMLEIASRVNFLPNKLE